MEKVLSSQNFKTSLRNGWNLVIDWIIFENGEYVDLERNYATEDQIFEILGLLKDYIDNFGVPTKGTKFSSSSGMDEVEEIYIPNSEKDEIHVYFKSFR